MMDRRRDCSVCTGAFALRKDGTLRKHAPPSGVVGLDHCPGGGKPPRTWADPAPAPTPAPPPPDPPSTLDCPHLWSGWTRLPTTDLDFRQCWWCWGYETQTRPPCALCGGQDARPYDVPDHGTTYVCTPCMEAL